MDAIYPVTALQKQQGEVKKAAQAGIVRITENGKGAYVFCSEEVFERMMQQVAEDAASKQERMVARQLTTLRGATCELVMANTFVTFEAQVLDSDDEWVLLLVPGRKQDERRVVRISQIREVRELA